MPTELMEANKHEVVSPSEAEQTRTARQFVPRADIYESHDQLILLADIPGVKPDDIEIMLEQNVLTIYGHLEVPEFPGYNLAYCEYGIGDFRRVFTLSNEIDREGIRATVKNGVLKLILPKSKRAVPRRIAVQSA